MSKPLIKEFYYDSPIEKVWDALTDVDKMKLWYFAQLEQFKPIFGFQFQFKDDDAVYKKEWIVTNVVDGRKLAHSWAYKGYDGTSEVIFDLFPENENTKLRVTHTNLESFPDDSHFKRERFEWGWNNLLGQNLKNLLQKSNIH